MSERLEQTAFLQRRHKVARKHGKTLSITNRQGDAQRGPASRPLERPLHKERTVLQSLSQPCLQELRRGSTYMPADR